MLQFHVPQQDSQGGEEPSGQSWGWSVGIGVDVGSGRGVDVGAGGEVGTGCGGSP